MNVLFTGGGTGGHLYPAIAIADALVAQGHSRGQSVRVQFIGAADRLEARIVPHAGYSISFVRARPLARRNPLEFASTVLMNLFGFIAALREVSSFHPDLVIATGGYVCFPVVLAARVLRALRIIDAPIALLEINAHPGLTNRLLSHLVDDVWATYAAAQEVFKEKFHQTGVPVRRTLLNLPDRTDACRWLGLDPKRKTILVMGGSQGARKINEAVTALVTRRALPADWQVLHISGDRDYEYIKAEQRQLHAGNVAVLLPYLDDLSEAYAASDLVVSRAGASTLGELATLSMPAVLIPYPHAAEDHQRINAQTFAQAGAAVVLEDATIDGDRLWWTLREVMQAETYEKMRAAAGSLAPKDALAQILQRVDALSTAKSAA